MIFLFTVSAGRLRFMCGAPFFVLHPFLRRRTGVPAVDFRAGVIARYHFKMCVSLIDEIRDGKA